MVTCSFRSFVLVAILLLTLQVNAQHATSARIILLNIDTRDTIFTADADSSGSGTFGISFLCGDRKYKNDMALICLVTEHRSWSNVVPMKASAENRYTFHMDNEMEFINILFSGNPYIEAWQEIGDNINHDFNAGTLPMELIDKLAAFQKRFPNSQITACIAYSIRRLLGSDFITKESRQRQADWKTITEGEGFFYDKLRIQTPEPKSFDCFSHPFKELHYQSATTPVDMNLLNEYIHVMVFWDPANPDLESLNELSTISKKLSDRKVFFTAVSTGTYDEIKRFSNTHPSCDGLIFIHDSHYCMTNNYLNKHTIATDPAIFIFDRTGTMAYVGALTSEVQGLVEKLLKTP